MLENSIDNVQSLDGKSRQGLPFLDRPPEERSRLLKQSISHLSEVANRVQPSFALSVYGSGLYGYNSQEIGKLDDLDILAISPREHNLANTLDNLKQMGIEIDDNSPLEALSENLKHKKIDFFRIKGIFQNIPMSIHFFAYESLANKHSPLQAFDLIYGGLTNKQKEDKQEANSPRTEIGFDAVRHDISYDYQAQNNGFKSARYAAVISRSKLPDEGAISPTIGVQAEKILNSKLIYQPTSMSESQMDVNKLLEKYWRTFVRSALFYRPNVTNDEIVDLLVRSKRYSLEYRNQLKEKIEFERNRLDIQKNKSLS
jgi:hypothetical protein